MKKIFNTLGQDRITFWSSLLSIIFLITSIFISIFFYRFLPPFLPLYNKMPWGYSRLGKTYEIFIPIVLATLFLVINSSVSFYVYKQAALLARFLCATTALICLFVLIFTVQIILLVK